MPLSYVFRGVLRTPGHTWLRQLRGIFSKITIFHRWNWSSSASCSRSHSRFFLLTSKCSLNQWIWTLLGFPCRKWLFPLWMATNMTCATEILISRRQHIYRKYWRPLLKLLSNKLKDKVQMTRYLNNNSKHHLSSSSIQTTSISTGFKNREHSRLKS